MTTRQTPDAVREAIIAAITKADANFGYSYRLTKMDDTGEEHTLFMDGFEPAVFSDREDGYPVIEQRRNATRTDTILAALDSRAGDAGEAREEAAHLITIDQRDAAEAALSDAYRAVCGREPEWSNNFSYEDAVREMREAATPAPAVDDVDIDSPAARLDMVRVALNGIIDNPASAVPLARAGLDFCDLTEAQRKEMRGDA